MDILQAMEQRHECAPIYTRAFGRRGHNNFTQEIERCNKASGLHIQLVLNEPRAFDRLSGTLREVFRRAELYRPGGYKKQQLG